MSTRFHDSLVLPYETAAYMKRLLAAAAIAAAFLARPNHPAVSAQALTRLAGTWSINRSLSEFPREIGFNPDWLRAGVEPGQDRGAGGGARSGSGGGRAGRRGSSGGSTGGARPPFIPQRESADDAKRVQLLTQEVRNPPTRLTIAESGGAIAITSDQGETRTFHPGRGQDVVHVGELSVAVTARWEEDRLIVVYDAEEGHQLRYTYSPTTDPRRLRIDAQFVERGGGDSVVRIYDPATATEPLPTTADARAALPGAPRPPPDSVPASPGGASAMQPPGSELKGLSHVGVVVEDLGTKAADCGLNRAAIESAVSTSLSNAGLTVAVNTDEDTYIYVNIMTTAMSTGFCVSRYDVSLFTNTTATLSYQSKPSLVQVALLHKGGFTGGGASQHAAGVLQGITQYAEQFARQIRDANR
jgi:hypothetical protein